jgi:6-phosphogluconolactonase (cycloisomerase 2 family)
MKTYITIIAKKQAMSFRYIASTFFLLLLGYSGFAQVPTITTFAPATGGIGTTVIITGTNFNTTPANNIVFFGATRATVSVGSSTSLTVTVPTGASYQPISVTNFANGLTAYSSKPFNTTFPFCDTITSSSFVIKANLTTGSSPYSVSTGDLDRDGKTDLAVVNNTSNTVSIFRNTGSSSTVSFAAKLDFTTGTSPVSISLGDLNGDFRLDLVVANTNSNTVSVFSNTTSSGIVSFAAKQDITTGSSPSSVSTGDFNGDGKLDLAVSNSGSNSVSVFRNTGSSGSISFAAKVDYTTGINPQSVSTGDLDGDGKTDIAIANYGSDSVSVFRNTSSGGTISFAVKVDFRTGTNPNSIAIGDLDVDGKLDLAIVNVMSSSVSVFRNTSSSGTISFANKVDFTTSGPISVSIGNLDGDGKPELAFANYGFGSVSVFRNTSSSGTISFATKVDFTTGESRGISIGDLDGDGKLDLAVANKSSNSVSVIINLDGICFPTITSFSPTAGPIGTTVIITGTKFNTIPANNIVFFGATKATVSASTATSLTVIVPMGASYQPISVTNITYGLAAYSSKPFNTTFPCGGIINTNSFAAKVDFTTGTNPKSVSTGDFDGDGKSDLAIVNATSNSVSVFRNTSSTGIISFTSKVDFTTGSGPYSVSIGDFDGDGKTDLAIANNGSNTISVFRNTGSSGIISFAAKVDFTTGNFPCSVSIGDFDGDGKTDLAVTNYSSNTISVFRNTGDIGTISFATKVDFMTETSPISISTGDLDGDGKTDIGVANYSMTSNVSVFRNTSSSGGTISFAAKVDFTTGGSIPRSISIGDLDGNGKLDIAIANAGFTTVSVFRNTGISGTISFASKVDFLSGETNYSISIGDLDGDGKLDLAVANSNATVSLFKNTGSSGIISFATKVDFTTGSLPTSISNGDFDGDGKLDLAVANNSSNSVSVLKNTIKTPTVTASASATLVCIGDSVTLTGGGANTYGWTSGVINGVAFVPPAGTTTYTVTGTVAATGCQNTATIVITVNTLLPTVSSNATATTVCAGETITLTGGGASTYTWSGGVTNGVAFVPPTGTTTYTVTGTKDGCRNTATKTITVNPLPTVTAIATATTICEGDTITLTGGGTANIYDWLDGVANGVPFVPIMGTNIYTVIGTNTTTGCVNTATKNIIVNPLPILEITATDITKCSGPCSGTASVVVTNGAAPYSYLWSNGQITNTASFLCQGSTVTVTDNKGCKTNSNINSLTFSNPNPNIYLTNLAAIDQAKLSPAFASFYSYNLPTTINANPSNPRNFVDAGKKARFKVECTNQKANGQSIVSGICKVRSNSPYIKITDSSSALNNIGWSNKAWSADEFEIDIDPKTPPGQSVYIDFVVQENGQDYATTCISIPVSPLVYSTTTAATIDDDNNPDSKGNDNDICDPNETIEFYPWLDNITALNAEYVRGRFENLDNHSFIKIWNDTQGVNTRVFDATWWNYSFAKPQTINSLSTNTTPEYDFVFNYKNNTTAGDFKLYMVMAGGFKLFNGDALSLVQWSLPFNFSGNGLYDSLNITPQNLSYSSVASSKQVTVNCNRTWLVNASQPWVTFNKTSGNGNDMLNVNVTENPTNSQRTATATLTAGSIIKTVTIIQDATVGINEVNKTNHITIYPNPTSGIVTISSIQTIANIEVFDVTGKLVYTQQNNNNQTNLEINLSALSNGIYFINAQTENGEISKSKLVISK